MSRRLPSLGHFQRVLNVSLSWARRRRCRVGSLMPQTSRSLSMSSSVTPKSQCSVRRRSSADERCHGVSLFSGTSVELEPLDNYGRARLMVVAHGLSKLSKGAISRLAWSDQVVDELVRAQSAPVEKNSSLLPCVRNIVGLEVLLEALGVGAPVFASRVEFAHGSVEHSHCESSSPV